MAGIVKYFWSGSKPKKHNPFRMLVIGETGSGKTSFLNLLCNFGTIEALGLGLDSVEALHQFRNFNDMQLENMMSSQMASKTSGAKLYNVELGELKLGIIDTPGFGDSRGIEEDEKNVKKIIAALENEETEFVNCVCLVINGRSCRSTVLLKYVLSEVTAILPQDVLNNVIVVFSNTKDILELNFKVSELREYFGKDIKNYFCIENPYCKLEKAKEKQDEIPLDLIAESLLQSFVDTAKVLQKMYTKIKDFAPIYTHRFVALHRKKEEVEGKVLTLLTKYADQRELEASIKRTQEEVDAALETKKLTKDYRIVSYRTKRELRSTSAHNTICGYDNCHSNCHYECSLSFSLKDEVIKNCATIEANGYCNENGCGHHYTYHYHARKKFVDIQEQVVKFSADMERQFKDASSQEDRSRLMQQKLAEELEKSEVERKALSRQLLEVMEEYHSLGVTRSYAILVDSQLQVIKTYIRGKGTDTSDLQETKEILEQKLQILTDTKELAKKKK